jgi:hypothetical protein
MEYAAGWYGFPLFFVLGIILGFTVGITNEVIIYRRLKKRAFLDGIQFGLDKLPVATAEFIRQIVKKMRYRKEVRSEVMAELTVHFEDELEDCKSEEEKQQKAGQLIEDFGDVKLLAVLLRRAKKRCRPLWRTVVARGFQTVGMLILCFIFYCVYISLGQPNIRVNYIQELTNLTRPVVDESQNAAPLYQKAIDLHKEPPEIELTEEELVSWNDKILLNAIREKEWVDELTDKELTALKTWISSNTEAIELFKQATDKPHCWWERKTEDKSLIISFLVPELRNIRDFSRLLSWRAILKANSGDIEEAFDDLLICYRAGRHFQGPRTLIEQLVGWAIQSKSMKTAKIILQHRQVEGLLLTEFQAHLEKLIVEGTYIPDYTTESFFWKDILQRCYTDNGNGSGHLIPGQLNIFTGKDMRVLNDFENPILNYGQYLGLSLITADRDKIRQMFENYYDNAQQWAHKTPWQLNQENIDFEIGIDEWPRLKQLRYWPVTVLMPALGRVAEIAHRCKLKAEALITMTGLFRYRQEKGQYPDDLNELVAAGYLKNLPMDCFSNKPLVYKKIDDDFLLYSYGSNCIDDNGKPDYDSKGKYRMWSNEDADAIFWPEPEPITVPDEPFHPEMSMLEY